MRTLPNLRLDVCGFWAVPRPAAVENEPVTSDIPTLILHGDDDQIVPIADSAMLSASIVKGSKLVVYKGGAHGMCTTEKDRVNADLLSFIQEG